jgi:hypothetical protein
MPKKVKFGESWKCIVYAFNQTTVMIHGWLYNIMELWNLQECDGIYIICFNETIMFEQSTWYTHHGDKWLLTLMNVSHGLFQIIDEFAFRCVPFEAIALGSTTNVWKLSSSNQWEHAAMSCMRARDEAKRIGIWTPRFVIWAKLFGLIRSPAHSLVYHDHQYTPHICWCGPPMIDSYHQGAFLELFLPVRVIGCNQCWYSPFTGSLHQQVWGVYKSKLLNNTLDNQDH